MKTTVVDRARPPRARALLAALAAALACAGCSVGASEAAPPVAQGAPTPGPAPGAAPAPAGGPAPGAAAGAEPAAVSPGIGPVGPADTRQKEVAGGFGSRTREFGPLTDVRVARQDGFDRIVLQFASAQVPDYRVGYIAGPVTADPSAEVVPVDGAAFLEVLTAPAGAAEWVDRPASYRGPNRIALPGGAAVREVVETGDFEETLDWVAGTGGELPFAVAELRNPARLVVDVLHPR
jgi:hypothetical protein